MRAARKPAKSSVRGPHVTGPELAHEGPAQPWAAYSLLPGRTTVLTVASLVTVAALGWAYTIAKADPMSSMVMGLGHVGRRMAMGMSVPGFLAMWAAMMVAMMAPTVGPMALAYQKGLPDAAHRAGPTAGFVVGFLFVWSATGLLALVPYRLILDLPASATSSRWLPVVAGAVLVGVGALQFSRSKVGCLRACRTPANTLNEGTTGGGGTVSGLRTGLGHGWRCLGCCWALMVILFVVGVMNLVWMALIALVFLVDKHWARAEGLTRVVGISLVALGLLVTVFPDVLPYISGAHAAGGAPMQGM